MWNSRCQDAGSFFCLWNKQNNNLKIGEGRLIIYIKRCNDRREPHIRDPQHPPRYQGPIPADSTLLLWKQHQQGCLENKLISWEYIPWVLRIYTCMHFIFQILNISECSNTLKLSQDMTRIHPGEENKTHESIHTFQYCFFLNISIISYAEHWRWISQPLKSLHSLLQ